MVPQYQYPGIYYSSGPSNSVPVYQNNGPAYAMNMNPAGPVTVTQMGPVGPIGMTQMVQMTQMNQMVSAGQVAQMTPIGSACAMGPAGVSPSLMQSVQVIPSVFHGPSQSAGTVYHSSAVYKRLKPSTASAAASTDSVVNGMRPQGRPFSSNITGRFLLHDDMTALLLYMNKKNTQRLAVYDFTSATDFKMSNGNGGPITSLTSTSSAPKKSVFCKFEDIGVEAFTSNDLLGSLDSFFGVRHQAIKVLNETGLPKSPSQRTITHHPPIHSANSNAFNRNNNSSENSVSSSNPPSSVSSVKSENSFSFQETSKCSAHALNFILNDKAGCHSPMDSKTDRTGATGMAVSDSLKTNPNFHRYIVDAFGIEEYQFIKAIRDSNGHILKLESVLPPRNNENKIEYSAEWVKRTICYPRYKGGMKIHLICDSQSFILYNDLKMMLWDAKQEDRAITRDATQQSTRLEPAVRNSLFGGRMVYVRII
ncbi:hypothetical protein FOA43_003885 [Brettanomyces nanus]|uniref:Uncharacterized protein n=1 Tax=Eeniella nana TaxID=13502 RepID=A0A875S5B7_EENNA|nr:uncharacterized protein FOA43_003885 [Brettanomyces nanus]QPG76496.1 hypothetical protein FOA43_003885 [Brettanomyces nanus]